MRTLTAKHDRVIMKAPESTEQTYDRVVLSDNGQEKSDQFVIVSIGPGITNAFTGVFTPNQYRVGDHVMVKKAFVHIVPFEGEDYFITKDSDILCGIEEFEQEQDELPF